MRGTDQRSGSLFSYVDIEERVPREHPLRRIRELVNGALSKLDQEFGALYSKEGRPSIPPERLLRASLLQVFYSIRSERQLMERMDFDLLFRWFVGLGVDDPVWDHSVFSKNRDRLLTSEIAQGFLAALLAEPKVKRLRLSTHAADMRPVSSCRRKLNPQCRKASQSVQTRIDSFLSIAPLPSSLNSPIVML